jgi:branched-chain amino acid transport system permease protein
MDTFITLLFSGLTLGAIYTLVSLGIVVLQKATGVINAAQFGLVALGAYLAFWASTDLGLPLVLASVLAIAILAVIGVVLERLTYAPLRSKPVDSVFLATLAGGFAMVGLIVLWYNADPRGLQSPLGYGTVSILGGTVPKHSLLVLAVSLLAVLGLSLSFNRTSFGRQVRALAADRNTARLYGVAANKLSIAAFALASAMAGLAGVLLGPIAALTPEMAGPDALLVRLGDHRRVRTALGGRRRGHASRSRRAARRGVHRAGLPAGLPLRRDPPHPRAATRGPVRG